jgi:hypothetical protein
MPIRRIAAPVLVSFLAGALIVAALPAGADRDDNMIVGRANGGKAYNTSLYSINNTATLSLYNKNGGGAPALRLHSNDGPALAITSADRIVNFNADYVDGYSAHRLLDLADGCGSATIGDPTLSVWTCDTAAAGIPTSGRVLATGSVDIQNNAESDVEIGCEIRRRYNSGLWSTVVGSARDVTVPAWGDAVCASTTSWWMSNGASLEVRFEVDSINEGVTLGPAHMWWIYVPG